MSAPGSTPSPTPAISFAENSARFHVDLRVYRLVAVQKTAYRLARSFTAIFGQLDDEHLEVSLVFGKSASRAEQEAGVEAFFRELLDQELREKIGEETRGVRDLILAHAFSRTSLRGQS